MTRTYHVVCINERTGRRVTCSREPMTHREAVTFKSKFNPHKDARFLLVEVSERSDG